MLSNDANLHRKRHHWSALLTVGFPRFPSYVPVNPYCIPSRSLPGGKHFGAADALANVAHGLVGMVVLGPQLHVGRVQRQQKAAHAQADERERVRAFAVARQDAHPACCLIASEVTDGSRNMESVCFGYRHRDTFTSQRTEAAKRERSNFVPTPIDTPIWRLPEGKG